jgi:phage gp29-like protein
MEQLYGHIQQLENKLIQLKEKYVQQKLIIEQLQQENEQLTLQKQQSPLIHKKGKTKAALEQLAHVASNDNIKDLLEHYIKQVTQCIDFLEKLN